MMSQYETPRTELDAAATLYTACTGPRKSQRVGVGAIGWGLLGASQVAEQRIVPAIRTQPAAQQGGDGAGAWVAALFSHNERLAHHFADHNQIPTVCLNLSDLLARHDVQSVYVSSHPRHHYSLVMAALTAGKHVLCEPPLALVMDEGRALVQTAADRGLLLGVNSVTRTTPALWLLRQLIREDTLGDLLGGLISDVTLLPPQRQTWRLLPGGGGVIYDRTIHSFDLLRFLFDDEVASVYGAAGLTVFGQSGAPRVEEEIVGQAQMARSRCQVLLHDAFFVAHRPARVELNGTHAGATVEQWAGGARHATLALHRHNRTTMLNVPAIDPFWWAIHRFQQAIFSGGPLPATGEDGLQSLAAANALHKSLRTRVPVWLATS
jgi:1,5-anhydro-D-fructose reductase (1,5-anhydro-D-mannitol-forming)